MPPTPTLAARRESLRARFPRWTPASLDGFLDRCAAEFGTRPMVITDERTATYADIAAWSRRLADGLVDVGVQPGDRVGLVMANYIEFVPLKFAIARAGAIAIPFNFLYRAEELGYVLQQSECNFLVTMTGFSDLDYLAMLDAIVPGWDAGHSERLPALRRVVLLPNDGRSRSGVFTVDDLAETGRAHPGGSAGRSPAPTSEADILYTSGTTGSPKGVVLTHDAVQRTGYASALTRGFEDGRRILFSLPCYHMFGYVEGLIASMFAGGAIILQTSFDPVGYFRGIERHRASDILCVPTMTVALLEHPERRHFDLSSLFAILSGAAPAPVWVWERARADLGVTEITTGYGMTECGGAMTLTLPEDPIEMHATTVGLPKMAGVAGLPDRDGALTEYKTIDPLTSQDLPDGTEGELASRGPTQMLRFFNKARETAEVIVDGWVHSGDLGRIRDDGYLQVTGRSKELYKSGGELVMPKEIEDLLSQHPGVSQAYAVGIPDDRWGEVGVVWVVREPGDDTEVGAGDLIDLCRSRLARFKVPRHVLFLAASELPATATGKVQKYRLRERAAETLGLRSRIGN